MRDSPCISPNSSAIFPSGKTQRRLVDSPPGIAARVTDILLAGNQTAIPSEGAGDDEGAGDQTGSSPFIMYW